jgi:hypothetical protein
MKKKIIMFMITLWIVSAAAFADINTPYRTGYIEGFIKSLGAEQITIEEYDGTLHTIQIEKNADLRIDNVPISIKEFKIGMEVYGELTNRKINYLEGYSTENPGFIQPGSKVRSGVVKVIDRNQLVLLTPVGEEERYFTSPSTLILKNGINVPHDSIYEGDRLRLYFNEIDSDMVNRIEIEGDSIMIKDLYRGRLQISDLLSDTIVVENVEKLRNNQWVKIDEHQLRIAYSTEMPLYYGGQKISPKDLKYYRGKTVYMAVKNYFGKDKIERMVIKGNHETLLNERITGINHYGDTFETGDYRNIRFHEGTIILKNGRLVNSNSIRGNIDAMVVANGKGKELSADIIQIFDENLNASNIGQKYLYTGRMNTILKDRLYIKDYFLLEDNEWYSYRTYSDKEERELFYDHDTHIYDGENDLIVSPTDFYAQNYAVDESTGYVRKNKLRDWHGYFFTDGNRIAAMMVQKNQDSLLAQRISIGSLDGIEDDPLVGWTITLRDCRDWSSLHDKWMPKALDLRVNIEKALLIKDGKRIEPEELRAGDRLYFVRDDFKGKVIIVR